MTRRLLDAYTRGVLGVWLLLALAILGYNALHSSLYLAAAASVVARFVLPALCAAGLAALCIAGRETRLVAANTLVGLMIALYGGEVYLAYRLDRDQQAAAARSGAGFDPRDKLTVIRDLRAAGVAAYPILRGKNMLLPDAEGRLQPVLSTGGGAEGGGPLLPMASLPHATVVSCNESGAWQIYEADRHGFNNPDAEWDAGRPAIGLIGDSFAHGSCVPRERNIAALLRPRFGPVLNLGVGGFGPLLELATLTEYLEVARPKIVLWAFFEGNDINEDLPFERRAPILLHYLHDPMFRQDLFHRSGEIAAAMKTYLDANLAAAMDRVDDPTENAMRYLSLDRVREAVGVGPVQIGFNAGALGDELDLFGAVMRAAKARTQGWGGRLYLVYLPESDRYLSRFGDSAMRRGIYDGVRAAAARESIPLIDVAAAFASDPDPGALYAYPGAHFSVAGYARAAAVIAAALDNGPVSPSSEDDSP
jgi:hypothetical protein